MMGKLKAHMDEQGTKLAYGEDVLNYIAEKSYSEKFGARNMRRFIEREVEDKLASLVIDNYENRLTGISLSVSEDEIKIDTI
jgi:ATP-dependent Clp protease ATP-binding subunit ClpA